MSTTSKPPSFSSTPTALSFIQAWKSTKDKPLDGEDPFALIVDVPTLYAFGNEGQLDLNAIKLGSDGTLSTLDPISPTVTGTIFSCAKGGSKIHSQSPSAAAAVVVGSTFCLFWNDESYGLSACITPTLPPSSSAPWYSVVLPPLIPGSRVGLDHQPQLECGKDQGCDVAACALGDETTVLVAAMSKGTGGLHVYIGAYEVNWAVAGQGTAPGTWSWSCLPGVSIPRYWDFSLSELLAPLSLSSEVLSQINGSLHMDWYSTADPKAKGVTSKGGVQNWLALTFYNPTAQCGYLCWLQLDTISSPLLALGKDVDGKPTTVYAYQIGNTPANPTTNYPAAPRITTPVNVKRDPSGAVRLYAGSRDQKGNPLLYAWTQPAQTYPGPNTPPDQDPAYPISAKTGSNTGDNLFADPTPPVPVYLISSNTVPTPLAKNPANEASPVYETIFCVRKSDGGDNSVILYVNREYGRMQQVNNSQAGQTPVDAVVRGIFDGPFPIPNENLLAFKGGNPNGNLVGNVLYGTVQGTGSARSLSIQGSVGIHWTEQASVGVGPAWDIAVSAGSGTMDTSTTETIVVNNVQQNANLDASTGKLIPKGNLAASAIDFQTSYYHWLVQDGANWKVSPWSAIWAVISAAPNSAATTIPFTPYSVDPGNLQSYTKEAWNANMRALGYPSDNYFDEVIIPNALRDSDGKLLTLSFSYTGDSNPADQSFEMLNTTVHELTWTFDSSFYYGSSGSASIDLFGLGEGVEYENLEGFTLDIEGSQTEQTQEQWGLFVSGLYIPWGKKPDRPVINKYNVTVYFLPASYLWMDELLKYGKPREVGSLDPNSQPWRVVYLVTSYEYSHSSSSPQPYPPPGSFQKPASPSMDGAVEYPIQAQPSVWSQNPGAALTYSVSFANASGEGPQAVQTPPGTMPGSGMCPQVTIPVDTSNPCPTTMRYLYRTIGAGPKQLVKIINDNKETSCYDDNPAYSFQPTSAPSFTGQWNGRSNLPYSKAFVPGNQVSYCLTYLFGESANGASGESAKGPYSNPSTVTWLSCPTLQVPLFPTDPVTGHLPVCTGRRIYRRTVDAYGHFIEDGVLAIQINDNTTTTDVDQGKAPTGTRDPRGAAKKAGA